MPAEELEITVEIVCTKLPGEDWAGGRPLHLGIQKDQEMMEHASAGSKQVVFRPVLRVRRHADGSPSFLGPFAQGPRNERFIYLVWAIVENGVPQRMVGRIKLHLNHLPWASVEKAAAGKLPIRATLSLTDGKGKPVMASVRPPAAQWQLP